MGLVKKPTHSGQRTAKDHIERKARQRKTELRNKQDGEFEQVGKMFPTPSVKGTIGHARHGKDGVSRRKMSATRRTSWRGWCMPRAYGKQWEAEPSVGRVALRFRRVDRLKGLGNAVVPQIVELIGRRNVKLKATYEPPALPVEQGTVEVVERCG